MKTKSSTNPVHIKNAKELDSSKFTCKLPTVPILCIDKSETGTIMHYTYHECFWLCFGLFVMVISQAAMVFTPLLMGQVIDEITVIDKQIKAGKEYDTSVITERCLLMIYIVIISSFTTGARGATFNSMGERIAFNIRYDLFFYIINKDIGFFDANDVDAVLSRITSDTSIISDGLGMNISMLARNLVQILVTVVIMAILSWKLTLVLFAGLIPIGIIVKMFLNKMKVNQKEIQDYKSHLNQVAGESMGNMRTVKAYACEQYEMDKFNILNKKVLDCGWKNAIYNGGMSLFTMGGMAFLQGLICWYAAQLHKNEGMKIGVISSFLLYLNLVIMSIIIMTFGLGGLSRVAGAAEKIVQMMRFIPEVNTRGGEVLDTTEGVIEFKDVTFHYPTKPDVTVCKNMSFVAEKNQVIALVGPSGSGKSSVINLIERFYNPESG